LQIYFDQNLAFLAVPKTGSTAFELALRPHADIVFAKRRKHMTAGQFKRRMVPFLDEFYGLNPEVVAIMRDPIEQIRSWYRYRARPVKKGGREDCQDLSFDDFVKLVIKDPQPPAAAIGTQLGFLSMHDGSIPVHHIFAYEKQPLVRGFLNDRFEKTFKYPEKNVSPDRPTPLSPEVEAELRRHRADEFALYQRVLEAGGHLQQYKG
jgi:hypothetical protein